jgi:hypothetical protein
VNLLYHYNRNLTNTHISDKDGTISYRINIAEQNASNNQPIHNTYSFICKQYNISNCNMLLRSGIVKISEIIYTVRNGSFEISIGTFVFVVRLTLSSNVALILQELLEPNRMMFIQVIDFGMVLKPSAASGVPQLRLENGSLINNH